MNTTIKIRLQKEIELQANQIDITKHHISLKELQKEFGTTLYLKKTHSNLNTVIDATQAADSVVLYFDEEKEKFNGASYIVNKSDAPFALQTQEENILIVALPIAFDLQQIKSIQSIIVETAK